jgi:predicted TIM-barrel fold metal-dependent hydrolase
MWSSDYPHTVSTWPHSREVVARDFKDALEKDKRQSVREHAARLYGFS